MPATPAAIRPWVDLTALDDADLLDALDAAVEATTDDPDLPADEVAVIQAEVDRRPSLELYHTPASEDDEGEPWSAPHRP